MPEIRTKRVYEAASVDDGCRVLVDRIWPRGMTKEQVRADLWLREVAPGTALRKWFGHDPAKWEEFRCRYYRELEDKPGVIDRLLEQARKGRLTLLFATRSVDCNHAVALRDYLLGRANAD